MADFYYCMAETNTTCKYLKTTNKNKNRPKKRKKKNRNNQTTTTTKKDSAQISPYTKLTQTPGPTLKGRNQKDIDWLNGYKNNTHIYALSTRNPLQT